MAVDSLYQFTLDNGSATVLSDEPLNFNTSKIKVERDEAIKGLFIQYITELEFVGDGYTYLLNEISSQGICGTVNISIEYRKNYFDTFSTLFDGIIYLKDIKQDLQKEIITVDIQDENFSRLIRDRKDFKVNTAATESINGVSITPPTSKQVALHRPQVDAYGTYQNSVRAYSCFDMFKLVIDYVTDGQVVFESSFFSGLGSRPETWKLDIAGAIATKTYTLTIVNQFGTFTSSFAATIGTTLETVLNELTGGISNDNSKSPVGVTNVFLQPYNAVGSSIGSFYDGTTWQSPYCIQSIWPITSITLTDGTATKVQDLNNNMGEMHITSGKMIYEMIDTSSASSDIEFFFTFSDIFNSLNSKFDLTFEMYSNGGIPTCKIEPTNTFFDSANPASSILSDIKNISREYTLKYKKSSISIDSEQISLQDELISGALNDYWYDMDADSQMSFNISNDCGEDSLSLDSSIAFQTKAYNKLFFDKVDDNGTPRPPVTYNERIFFVDIYQNGGLWYSKQYQYINQVVGGVLLYFYLGYNFFMSTIKSVSYWMFSLGDTAKFARLEVSNDNTIKFDTILNFDVPIDNVDWSNILNNLTDKITISGQGLVATDVWIENIEIDVFKGMAQFSCLTSS